MRKIVLVILYYEPELYDEALDLASIIPNSSCQQLCQNEQLELELYLYLRKDGLYLFSSSFKPINLLNFYSEFIVKRRASIHRELLIQAIGMREQNLSALDITAGLGRDSILMSLAGFNVTMIESNPYLAIILNYLCGKFTSQLPSLKLIYGDSYKILTERNQNIYDLIYVDPMFNDSKKALAKKDMQLIDLLINQVSDVNINYSSHDLLVCAVDNCRNKVVVKRDNKQSSLSDKITVTYNKKGKTIRFDVYQCTKK